MSYKKNQDNKVILGELRGKAAEEFIETSSRFIETENIQGMSCMESFLQKRAIKEGKLVVSIDPQYF